jgi:hypothetical protein
MPQKPHARLWFVLREKNCWLVAAGWFVLREKYCWLVADKPSEQGAQLAIQYACKLATQILATPCTTPANHTQKHRPEAAAVRNNAAKAACQASLPAA